ncbi:HdaA/DnaA family protein [Limnobacter parvus]|uniref:DnaA/Hda family protein n=1 Tax=Limnobacter parvus TaxID=2939690 RepID=A0ABT1XGH1_9BURK|nr:DnaA/Hda family protein [Limnobacter parvus]MCR2746360.1 DnaA/Hda family protein [Limnobacter parvus]
MQQLLLDVFTPPRPTLSNFLVGQNGQLVHELQLMLNKQGTSPFMFIYGPKGCGKSHLLRGVATQLGVTVTAGSNRFVFKQGEQALVIDNIDLLTPYSQVQLFNAFNSSLAENKPGKIILASEFPTPDLKLRDDLRTRIEAGLCLRVQPLSDQEKHEALQAVARSRGLQLSEEVIEYALRYFQRDMGSLMAVMDGLDRFSLEQQKPVSVHLLRHWMKRRESLVIREYETRTV